MTLARDSDLVPLYRRISNDLGSRIASGEFGPGKPIPTERELGEHYAVSRITIRKALDELVGRGLVTRRRGLGTFVQHARRTQWSVSLIGVMEDVLLPYRFTVTEERDALPPAHILGLAPTAERAPHRVVGGINFSEEGQPLVRLEYFFPPGVGELLTLEALQAAKGAIDAVQQVTHRSVQHAEQVVEAIIADRDLCDLFTLPAGAPVLRITRAFYDTDGKVLQLYCGAYHPTHYRYTARLNPRDV